MTSAGKLKASIQKLHCEIVFEEGSDTHHIKGYGWRKTYVTHVCDMLHVHV